MSDRSYNTPDEKTQQYLLYRIHAMVLLSLTSYFLIFLPVCFVDLVQIGLELILHGCNPGSRGILTAAQDIPEVHDVEVHDGQVQDGRVYVYIVCDDIQHNGRFFIVHVLGGQGNSVRQVVQQPGFGFRRFRLSRCFACCIVIRRFCLTAGCNHRSSQKCRRQDAKLFSLFFLLIYPIPDTVLFGIIIAPTQGFVNRKQEYFIFMHHFRTTAAADIPKTNSRRSCRDTEHTLL